MAKVQIKSEKLTPFGGIFSIMEQFDALLAQTIDSTLGLRCTMCLVINIARFQTMLFWLNQRITSSRFASKIPLNPIGCGFEV